jgi:tetratricopeptide (TPR) repeat protein
MKDPPGGTACRESIVHGTLGPAALVVCATVLAYLPSLSGDFIWNDSDYVTAPALRSIGGLVRIWTEPGATEQYYPLLHSAFWVQHRLFGDHPLGYHIVTLLLHAGSAVLFGLVLRLLFRDENNQQNRGPAKIDRRAAGGSRAPKVPFLPRPYAGAEWVAAMLFALHPVHVESVAWITEQKNTLSLVFYLAAALVYLQFDESRRPRTYVAALAFFVLSLWCKTVTVTLPAALLVVLWWKRGALGWRRDVLPLLPWLVLGAAAGLFSSWVERHYGGAEGGEFDLPFMARGLVAGRAIWFYIGKLVWPFDLNFVYPRWTVDAGIWWQWLFPLGVLGLAAALWGLRRRTRAPLAAFLIFAGSLFPVLGFVNLYGERYSWVWDHWQYLPDLGPLALAAAGLIAIWQRVPTQLRRPGAGLAAALVVLLGALTWSHCEMFHDDETLYQMTLARNPACWMAHFNLGNLWSKMPGRLNDAIAQYEEALRLKPDHARAHFNLGVALSQSPERLNDAVAEFDAALRLMPDLAEAHYNLGLIWSQMPGRLNDAIAEYEKALRLKPDFADVHNNLGNAWSRIPGRLDDAIAQYQAALRLMPDSAETHNNLGFAWSQTPGRMDDAVAQYNAALRLRPGFAEAHNNLGVALAHYPGRLNDAIAQFEEALRLKSDFAGAHENLGFAWSQTPGRINESIAEYEAALRLKPDSAIAHFNLANALSKEPLRLNRAIAQYKEALRLKPDLAPAWHNLGASFFHSGDLPAAAAAFREELRLTPDSPAAKQALAAALQQAGDR